jgi:hypothetical protein
MGDHFWPALYPGIIVGVLYGLSLRGVGNTIIGALGGVAGAAIAYAVLVTVDLNNGLQSVVGLVALALLGAVLATRAFQWCSGSRPPKAG